MNETSPKLVQFMHPGAEHGPDKNGGSWKGWNRGNHRRKFLQPRGTYQHGRASAPTEARPLFWASGRRSPRSPLEPTAPGEPRWLHRPRLQPLDDYRNAQNTDPFVFGNAFLYTCCKQFLHSGAPTQLNSLSSGSVLLFGSHVNGEFALDTVFVVGGTSEHMTSGEAERKVTKSYWNTTIRPMYEMDPTVYTSNEAPWRLYREATPKSRANRHVQLRAGAACHQRPPTRVRSTVHRAAQTHHTLAEAGTEVDPAERRRDATLLGGGRRSGTCG